MHGSELVYEIRADDVPALQLGNAIQRELPQRRMRFQPAPEWHAETMLCLADDLMRQKTLQGPLEKISQPRAAQFQIWRQAGGKGD